MGFEIRFRLIPRQPSAAPDMPLLLAPPTQNLTHATAATELCMSLVVVGVRDVIEQQRSLRRGNGRRRNPEGNILKSYEI